jgi:hypothetical protein
LAFFPSAYNSLTNHNHWQRTFSLYQYETETLLPNSPLAVPTLCRGETYGSDYAETISSHYDGTNYISEITQTQLRACPIWQDKQDNPPVSVKTAATLARAELMHLVKDADSWYLEGVLLEKIGPDGNDWVYKVVFMPPMPPLGYGAILPEITVVVLMNGQIIHPKVTPMTGPIITK